MISRATLAATAAIALSLPAAADAQFAAMTADHSAPIVHTDRSLVAEDSNHADDYYAVVGGVPKLLTSGAGTDEYQQLWRASGDGSIAFFRTADALVAEDTDDLNDLYVRRPDGVSVIAPQAGETIDVVDLSTDGVFAFLRTKSPLLPADADAAAADVYRFESTTGTLVLLTPGTASDVNFHRSTGGTAIVSTVESLEAGDTDAERDVYYAADGLIGRLSAGNGPHPALFRAYSPETGRVLFSTTQKLVAADTDDKADLYESDGNAFLELRTPVGSASDVSFLAASAIDMHRVIFSTPEKLVAGDTDDLVDYYAHDNGALTLITPGTGVDLVFEDASTDAEVVLISTRDSLLASDTDDRMDMYRTGDFGRVHVNKTNGPFDEFAGALSDNGVLTAFETAEPVAGTDTDTLTDAYRLDKGGVHIMSRREAGVTGPEDHVEVRDFLANSELIVETPERLLPGDRNDEADTYAAGFSGLTLVTADESAPDTRVEAPAQVLPATPVEVDAAATERGTLECRLDGGEWQGCDHGWSLGGLIAGTHTVEARATDVNGNVDATPAAVTVTAGTPQTVTNSPQTPAQTQPQTSQPPLLPGADAVAPVISKAGVRVRRRVPALTFSLTEKASVTVTVQRRSGGRWKTLRRKVLAGTPGANRAALPKLPRRGSFRFALVATDAAGHASARLVLRPKGR